MKKSETVVLTVDTGGAESAVKDILAGFQSLKTLAKDIGKAMVQAFIPLQNSLAATAGSMRSVTEAVTDATAALQNFAQAQAGDQLAEDIKDGFGFINGMISGIVRGVNAVIGVLNKLQFAVPDWIPGIGGMRLGFNLKEVTAPQIPYLARGAVLPANKPFMAVVGDQRHGTNIEAPLATIQEAVRMELGQLVGALTGGMEALLEENRCLRRTVESIELGDTVIGQAAARYADRYSRMTGGIL